MTKTYSELVPAVEQIEIQYSMDAHAEEAIFNAVAKLKAGTYLEIGTAYGRTLFLAGNAAEGRDIKCYGIDNLSLLKPNGGEAQLRASFKDLNNVELIISNSDVAPWDKPIDILVIDGCHIASEVKKDYEKYIPFLKSGGLLFIDDWSDTGIDTDYLPKNAHWGIAYYGKQMTQGWAEIEISGSRAKCFIKP